MAHMKHSNDARFTSKLDKPTLLANRRMALTFIPEDPAAPCTKAQIDISGVKIREMVTQLRQGAVRLQIATGFSEREIVFEDGAEVLFLYQMLDDFITGLPEARGAE